MNQVNQTKHQSSNLPVSNFCHLLEPILPLSPSPNLPHQSKSLPHNKTSSATPIPRPGQFTMNPNLHLTLFCALFARIVNSSAIPHRHGLQHQFASTTTPTPTISSPTSTQTLPAPATATIHLTTSAPTTSQSSIATPSRPHKSAHVVMKWVVQKGAPLKA
ncbi:hypothetical protein XPA_003113 [Xanthoria parietina]